MLRRLLFIGYDFGKHMSKKNISAFAASTAFFLADSGAYASLCYFAVYAGNKGKSDVSGKGNHTGRHGRASGQHYFGRL